MMDIKEREFLSKILQAIHSDVNKVTEAMAQLLDKNNALEERINELEMLLKEN